MHPSPTQLHLYNRQDEFKLPLKRLGTSLHRALEYLPSSRVPLPLHVEITFVSPEVMCEVHAEFLKDASITDVITFHHGEILISPRVAADQASAYQHSLEDEILFYSLHGLLHLLGWKDNRASDRQKMHNEQTRIMTLVQTKQSRQMKSGRASLLARK